MLKNLRVARLGLALTVALGASSIAMPVAVAAPSVNRAAVIVETSNGTNRIVIEFTEDSITGIEALRRAGAEPVLYSYSGVGGAVCRLFGVGRDSGADCLGGTGGDARYWAYFRSASGTSSFKYSSIGAGSTTVRDGDVEGWRFGTGAAPAYVSLASLLGGETTTSTTTTSIITPTSIPAAGTQPNSSGAGMPAGTPVAGAVGAGDESTKASGIVEGPSGAVDNSSESSPRDRSISGVPAVAVLEVPAAGGGKGPGSLILLALGLSGLVGCTIWARKARARASSR